MQLVAFQNPNHMESDFTSEPFYPKITIVHRNKTCRKLIGQAHLYYVVSTIQVGP